MNYGLLIKIKSGGIVYYIDSDAIVILDVFQKLTRTAPQSVLKNCRKRLAQYMESTK